jgi:hypothetical protein
MHGRSAGPRIGCQGLAAAASDRRPVAGGHASDLETADIRGNCGLCLTCLPLPNSRVGQTVCWRTPRFERSDGTPFALRKTDTSYTLGVFIVHVAVPSSKKEMQHMASPHRTSSRYACGIAALAFSVAAPWLAQSQARGEGSPWYDLATEATVTGTVESVEQITDAGGGRGRRGWVAPTSR